MYVDSKYITSLSIGKRSFGRLSSFAAAAAKYSERTVSRSYPKFLGSNLDSESATDAWPKENEAPCRDDEREEDDEEKEEYEREKELIGDGVWREGPLVGKAEEEEGEEREASTPLFCAMVSFSSFERSFNRKR